VAKRYVLLLGTRRYNF